jgi:hypothetical protein
LGTYSLVCHPDTPAKAIESVSVELERLSESVWLRFIIDGPLNDLVLPNPAKPMRRDGLWRTTCLEAFVRDSTGEGYTEFNFSPSHEWAAYSFSSYREGMEPLDMGAGPDIGLDASDTHLALEATIPLRPGHCALALSAVIEETDGTKSYWALAHPSGKPDFHHPTCFTASIPAPDIA